MSKILPSKEEAPAIITWFADNIMPIRDLSPRRRDKFGGTVQVLAYCKGLPAPVPATFGYDHVTMSNRWMHDSTGEVIEIERWRYSDRFAKYGIVKTHLDNGEKQDLIKTPNGYRLLETEQRGDGDDWVTWRQAADETPTSDPEAYISSVEVIGGSAGGTYRFPVRYAFCLDTASFCWVTGDTFEPIDVTEWAYKLGETPAPDDYVSSPDTLDQNIKDFLEKCKRNKQKSIMEYDGIFTIRQLVDAGIDLDRVLIFHTLVSGQIAVDSSSKFLFCEWDGECNEAKITGDLIVKGIIDLIEDKGGESHE